MAGTSFSRIPGADGAHPTFCRLCEAQCGLIADVEGGRIVKVRPDRDHPVSEGHLCVKGPGMAAITHDPDRVTTPLRRVGGAGMFEPVGWDEALDDIADRLKAIIARHGGAAIGLYQGNPAFLSALHIAYSSTFLRSLGGSKLFSVLHNDGPGKTAAMGLVYDNPADKTFPDLERCDFLLILGGNPLVSHMSFVAEPRVLHRLDRIHAKGGVVVVDPRRTETARKYEHVPIRPSGDAWLLGAMLHHIFEQGLEDRAWLDRHGVEWQGLRDAVEAMTPERAESECDVPADRIRALAVRMAKARTAAAYGRLGTNRGRYPSLTNVFTEALNIVTGRFGEAGGWVIGKKPFARQGAPRPAFPPHGAARSRIGDLPMMLGYTPGGLVGKEITTPGQGQMRALFVTAGNPVNSYPNGAETAAALEQLDLLVALDFYVTETTRHAHYILPTPTFYERPDFTEIWVANAPRPWVQFTQAVIEPVGEARAEFDIYNAVLSRLGKAALFAEDGPLGASPSLIDVIDTSLRKGTYGDDFGARPDGLSVARLIEEFPSGVRPTPSVDPAHSWTRVLTPDGKPRLCHPVVRTEIDRLLQSSGEDKRGILRLFGRRRLSSMNSWMHNVEKLVRSDRPTLQMHPRDAADRLIGDGQHVELRSASGAIRVTVELTDAVTRGAVSYPHGWGNAGGWRFAASLEGENINQLASSEPEDWEQVSAAVHLDGIEVTVTPIEAVADAVGG
jgi:anaerobic selenocysteine-containing dehydrogenase